MCVTRWAFQASVTHPPQRPEVLLAEAQQLAGLPRDDGGVPRRVVQDGLPERRPHPQRADRDRILRTERERSRHKPPYRTEEPPQGGHGGTLLMILMIMIIN